MKYHVFFILLKKDKICLILRIRNTLYLHLCYNERTIRKTKDVSTFGKLFAGYHPPYNQKISR